MRTISLCLLQLQLLFIGLNKHQEQMDLLSLEKERKNNDVVVTAVSSWIVPAGDIAFRRRPASRQQG